jgi:hypothetical protein
MVQAKAKSSLDLLNRLAPVKHTMRNLTNQQVLTLFSRAFLSPDYFDNYVTRAGLASIANNRLAMYTGLAIEDLPLFQVEKEKLVAAL